MSDSDMISEADVRRLLRDECEGWGSKKAFAEAHGISPAYVSDVLLGNRQPGEKICDALNLECVRLYRPKP